MNYSTAIFLINDDVRAIRCAYDPGCAYEPDDRSNSPGVFKTFDHEIAVDDFVVVQTNTRHGLTVVKVIEADVDVDFDIASEMKWILQKVEKEPFDLLLKQEVCAIDAVKSAEKRKRRDEMRTSLFKDSQEKLKALALTKMEDD